MNGKKEKFDFETIGGAHLRGLLRKGGVDEWIISLLSEEEALQLWKSLLKYRRHLLNIEEIEIGEGVINEWTLSKERGLITRGEAHLPRGWRWIRTLTYEGTNWRVIIHLWVPRPRRWKRPKRSLARAR